MHIFEFLIFFKRKKKANHITLPVLKDLISEISTKEEWNGAPWIVLPKYVDQFSLKTEFKSETLEKLQKMQELKEKKESKKVSFFLFSK